MGRGFDSSEGVFRAANKWIIQFEGIQFADTDNDSGVRVVDITPGSVVYDSGLRTVDKFLKPIRNK